MIDDDIIKDISIEALANHVMRHGTALTRQNPDGTVDLFIDPWVKPETDECQQKEKDDG